MPIINPNANLGGASGALLKARQTWTFVAGTTGAVAATPTHTLFSITGRVYVQLVTAFATVALTSGGTPAITIGTLLQPGCFMAAPTGGAPGVLINTWWTKATQANGAAAPLDTLTGGAVNTQIGMMLHEDIGLAIPVSTVTGGTLVIDVWYQQITDGSGLVAATPA